MTQELRSPAGDDKEKDEAVNGPSKAEKSPTCQPDEPIIESDTEPVANSDLGKSNGVEAPTDPGDIDKPETCNGGLDHREPVNPRLGLLSDKTSSSSSESTDVQADNAHKATEPVDEVDANPSGSRFSPARRKVEPSVPTDRDCAHYNISGLKTAIVFNHKKFDARFDLTERNGTECDVVAIQKTFKSLGWEVTVHNDLTTSEIRSVMQELQFSEATSRISAIAVFVLSHGEDNGTVFAKDSMYRVDHDILDQLTANKCPYLAGKPKMIFVQACQGKVTDPGTDVRRRHTSQDSAATYKIPNFADFLIFQASFWNHFSFRSSEKGSWFIQALCDKIRESQEGDSLHDILTDVSRSVSLEKESYIPTKPELHQKKQTPLLYSTMLRRIYLKGTRDDTNPKRSPSSDKPSPKRTALPDTSRSDSKPNNCICM